MGDARAGPQLACSKKRENLNELIQNYIIEILLALKKKLKHTLMLI